MPYTRAHVSDCTKFYTKLSWYKNTFSTCDGVATYEAFGHVPPQVL